MELTKEEVVKVFMNTPLEENYNFLDEDLVKLANAFVREAISKLKSQKEN
jgi:hypothetical protein